MNTPQPQPPLVLGEKVWCPRCGEYVKIVRVASAAKIVDVDRRTIYNYIKKNKVHTFKVGGGTLRVCTHCCCAKPSAYVMLEVDDSDFTPDHIEFLREWANNLDISVEVLLARIILGTSEGDQYVEKVPEYRPTPRD